MIPLHNHSHYSALDGYGTPEEIADRAHELRLSAIAISDHGTVAGWHPMQKALAAKDIDPIYGVEFYQARVHRKARPDKRGERDGAHLILLAKDYTGYKNIMRLSDEANRSGFYYSPRVDWELLEKYSEGVIATSACMAGLVARGIRDDSTDALNRFLNIFRDDFYLEIHTYDSDEQRALNHALWALAVRRGIPVVAATDAHFPSQAQYVNHEVLMAIQYNKQYDANNPLHPNCLYIMDEIEVRERLAYLPDECIDESLMMTDLIADQCRFVLPETRQHLPKFSSTTHTNSNLMLIDLVELGLENRYGKVTEEIYDRALFELEAIIDAGLADYFLIVHDFITWCEKKSIMLGPSRGSAGSCLLAYALGITEIDPLKYNLYFERFWNPGRTKGLPDIDIDIEVNRRAEVKEYLGKKYGANRVLSIGAYATMGPKAAVRKVMKALYGAETSYIDLKEISRLLEQTTDAGLVADWPKIYKEIGDELAPFIQRYPNVFELAEEFTDRITHYTTHASGVVVSDVDLPDELPCRQDRKEELLVTQVDMHEVEAAGHAKFDLLGIKTLDTLRITTELAGVDFDYRSLNYNTMPDSFWMQIDKGHTLGLFQIEDGEGAKRIGRLLKPRSIADLALIVGLNRPGPLRSGDTERFLARLNSDKDITPIHPIVQPILKDTYQVFVWQEQVTALFTAIGYDLSEADQIRKIMGKKKPEEMAAEYPRYMERASRYMEAVVAETLWNAVVNYSKYGFNMGHGVGYGTLLAWTMYAKWKWPMEFILASIITSEHSSDKQERIAKFIGEARRLSIPVSPPDVNASDVFIRKSNDIIYFGLQDIKGIGKTAAQWIIDHRPYTSYEQFMEIFNDSQREWGASPKGRSPKQILRANQIQALYTAGAFDSLGAREDVGKEEKVQLEEELLGVMLTDTITPVYERHQSEIDDLDPLTDIGTDNNYISVPGVITSIRTSRVRPDAFRNAGAEFAWVSIEWKGEATTFAAFPEEYKELRFMLKPRVLGRFDLKCGKRGPSLVGGTRYM